MSKPYRSFALAAISVLMLAVIVGCSGSSAPTEAPRPWARFSAQDVIDALTGVGLPVQNAVSDQAAGRGAPLVFTQRMTFEIPRIAPLGGQVVVFGAQDDMAEWLAWVETIRNDPETRRTVVYTYTNQNAWLQLSAELTNAEATVYRETFLGLQ